MPVTAVPWGVGRRFTLRRSPCLVLVHPFAESFPLIFPSVTRLKRRYLEPDGGMLLISAPLILVSACTARTHSHGWPLPPHFAHWRSVTRQSYSASHKPPEPAESESEPARIARSPIIIGEDPRNFTLAHSPLPSHCRPPIPGCRGGFCK
jgi:hypothetical protein